MDRIGSFVQGDTIGGVVGLCGIALLFVGIIPKEEQI
jgi:hypothetical protein